MLKFSKFDNRGRLYEWWAELVEEGDEHVVRCFSRCNAGKLQQNDKFFADKEVAQEYLGYRQKKQRQRGFMEVVDDHQAGQRITASFQVQDISYEWINNQKCLVWVLQLPGKPQLFRATPVGTPQQRAKRFQDLDEDRHLVVGRSVLTWFHRYAQNGLPEEPTAQLEFNRA